MLSWLYLDFFCLQLDSLLQGKQGDKKIAVVDSVGNLVQVSNKAKLAGLKPGQGLAQAALLTPDLDVYAYQSEVEIEQLNMIAEKLYSITSDICLVKPNGLLISCKSMLSLYNGGEDYWRAISQTLTKLAVTYNYATGHTALIAKALAVSGLNVVLHSSQQANKIINDRSLKFSDISLKEQQSLARVGISTFGQLLELPLDELAQRYSSDLVNYLSYFSGKTIFKANFYQPLEKFKSHIEFDYEISLTKHIAKPLESALLKQQKFLIHYGKKAYEAKLILHFREQSDLLIELSSAQAEDKAAYWLRLFKLRLEQVALAAPSIGLTICTEGITSSQPIRNDLFDEQQSGITPLALTALLKAKLGNDQVKSIGFTNDLRPEYAAQETTQTSVLADTAVQKSLYPSFMLPKPKPLTVKVEASYGPERIVTGWWDGEHVARDYYIARDHKGSWLWVFRTPSNDWYIHGVYS